MHILRALQINTGTKEKIHTDSEQRHTNEAPPTPAHGFLNVTVWTDLVELRNGIATTRAVRGASVHHRRTGHCVLDYRIDTSCGFRPVAWSHPGPSGWADPFEGYN